MGAEEAEAEQDLGEDTEGVGGGNRGEDPGGGGAQKEGRSSQATSPPRSSVLQILPELRPRGSRARPRCSASQTSAAAPFQAFGCFLQSDCTTTGTPSGSTQLSRTNPGKQPRKAATPGWESRSQQVRRSPVPGAQSESRSRRQRRQLAPGI